MTLQKYDGKVALVTGATGGIGAEIARRLSDEGASVLACGRALERGTYLVRELGSSAHFHAADLADPKAPHQMVSAAVGHFGQLDILINNAAIDHTGEIGPTSLEEIEALFRINAIAPISLIQEAARVMCGGSSIVNISSRLAQIGAPTMAFYSATKGALEAFTRGAAIELAPRNIRVNAVAPGMTQTPLFSTWLAKQDDPERVVLETAAKIPQGRLATPADVAAAVAFLGSDEASHVTGATLAVDGGYTAA